MIYVWDVETGESLAGADLDRPVLSVAYSLDGREMAAGTDDGTFVRWNSRTWEWIGMLYYGDPSPVSVIDLMYGPGHSQISYGSTDGFIRTFDLDESRIVRKLHGHSTAVRHIAVGFFRMVLASGSAGPDGQVRLWSPYILESYVELPRHPGDITGLAFSPDGTLLVTSSYNSDTGKGTLRLWGIPAGEQ